ncbi:response regulator [Oligoflexaceae bacterium]|nr:response regulator [Oligoflexaceae bacterium]
MSKNILIVDDDPDIVELLETILRNAGYETDSAQNGMECLQMVKKNPPDLILMDIMMPILDGVKTLESLYKDNVSHRNIPVIMVSGYLDDENAQIAKDLGARDAVSKPFKQDELLEVIAKHANPEK